jgi:hypothetical protein
MPVVGEIKEGVVIAHTVLSNPTLRPPVKVSLGCHVQGVSLPHVDYSDTHTVIAGVGKRFAVKNLEAKTDFLVRLKTFVYLWCIQNLIPLPPDTDLSLDSWLEQTGYSRARINALKKKWADCGGVLTDKNYHVKMFVKDESYPEFKHARLINARSDEFKCATGPTFKAIEQSVFKSDYFIKKIPCKDRAKYIFNNLYRLGAKYICTDYTAFEAHFVSELMEACEFVLYDYMTQYLPNKDIFYFYVHHVIGAPNTCSSKLVTVKNISARMSGEMCTSLGNGFSNLMFMLFVLKDAGCYNVNGVVEGDDGLFVFDGPIPTSLNFADIGLNIKLIVVDDLAKASFCGLVFDTTDLINIADPMKILAQTGFSTQQYVFSKSKVLRGLLKAKAFSLAYQYPGCPIISSFSRYLLRVLADDYVYFKKGNTDYTDLLQKEAFNFWKTHADVLSIETGMNTRMLMEQVFGISIPHQLHMENYFDNLHLIVILDDHIILVHMPNLWKDYASQYMLDAPLDPYSIRSYYD